MEYDASCSLPRYIVCNNKLIDNQFLANLGRQLLSGFQWLHGMNILHGNPKPNNILVFPGQFYMIWELRSAIDLGKGKVNRCLTTYNYAAPEMIEVEIVPTDKEDSRPEVGLSGYIFFGCAAHGNSRRRPSIRPI